jgi:MraZ protein
MNLFLSTYVNKIDRKGRVSVPAPFRAVLSAQASANQVVLFPSREFRAVEGCSLAWIDRLSASLDDPEIDAAERDAIEFQVFASLETVSIDAEGRISLPETLAAYAGIAEEATFIGKRHTFQIWNGSELDELRTGMRERGANLSMGTLISRAVARDRARGGAG